MVLSDQQPRMGGQRIEGLGSHETARQDRASYPNQGKARQAGLGTAETSRVVHRDERFHGTSTRTR